MEIFHSLGTRSDSEVGRFLYSGFSFLFCFLLCGENGLRLFFFWRTLKDFFQRVETDESEMRETKKVKTERISFQRFFPLYLKHQVRDKHFFFLPLSLCLDANEWTFNLLIHYKTYDLLFFLTCLFSLTDFEEEKKDFSTQRSVESFLAIFPLIWTFLIFTGKIYFLLFVSHVNNEKKT